MRTWGGQVDVQLYDIAKPEYAGKDTEALVAALGPRLEETFVLADLGVDEVGLVMKNGKLEDLFAPGTRKLYWKGLTRVEIEERWPGHLAEWRTPDGYEPDHELLVRVLEAIADLHSRHRGRHLFAVAQAMAPARPR